MDYIAYIRKDAKSDFGVSFPDFPGCVTAGKSLDDARRKAPEALAFHIAGMLEDGEKIPKPSKLDDLASDPDRKGAVAFLVTAELPSEKTVRTHESP
ncbi:MAG TPA: type II toxin-antitoxin system HicB family antitoxin [Candidatus Methylomirabilis sp.]|nr:type II toxin-antitoxin system HicB family antitoxin [Candidatus Methylomirabilis sp.]